MTQLPSEDIEQLYLYDKIQDIVAVLDIRIKVTQHIKEERRLYTEVMSEALHTYRTPTSKHSFGILLPLFINNRPLQRL